MHGDPHHCVENSDLLQGTWVHVPCRLPFLLASDYMRTARARSGSQGFRGLRVSTLVESTSNGCPTV